MYINEIEPGAELEVFVRHGDVLLPYFAKVSQMTGEVKHVTKILQAKARLPFIIIDKRLVGFDSINLAYVVRNVYMAVSVEGKRYTFKPDSIKQVILPSGRGIYIVFREEPLRWKDRRSAYRVQVDDIGIAIFERTKRSVPVIVTDVSYTGVGILVGDNIECKVDDKITMTFKTEDVKQILHGIIVRVVDREGPFKLLGCTVDPKELR